MKVNLWDNAFAHVPYSVPGRVSTKIEWVRGRTSWSGVTIFTDERLTPAVLNAVQSTTKIGWLLEGRAYGAHNYERIPRVIDSLDLLLTHDAEMLDRYPEKARFVPFGGCWIPDAEWIVPPKAIRMDSFRPHVSHIYSAKRFMDGHNLRHLIAAFITNLERYGHGSPRPVESKVEALAPYGFSVVVENDRAKNYFTEKLIDCFALGVVPLYWGCPNIGEFFDMGGLITFTSVRDLEFIIDNLTVADYSARREAMLFNQKAARHFVLAEDWIYDAVLAPAAA